MMKKVLGAFGKALLYFVAFLGVQLIVSFAFGIVASVNMMLEIGVSAPEEQILEAMSKLESEITAYATLIALITNALSLILIWLFFKLRKKKLFIEIGLHKCNFKLLLVTAVFGVSFSNIASVIVQMLPFPESMVKSFTESHAVLNEGNPIIGFIAVVFLAPITEEVFFRGLIYTRLKRGIHIIPAAIISSLLFGALHGEVIWIMITFLMGLMLVWVFERTKSLLPCIAVHALNNALAQITSYLADDSGIVEIIILGVCVFLLICSVVYIRMDSKKNV